MTTAEKPVLPVARTCPFAPPEEYTRMREDQALTQVSIPDGKHAWVVTRHEDARRVLNDRRFSSNRFHPGYPFLVEGGNPFRGSQARPMISMDAAEHSAARKSVLGEFTVKRVDALRPRIQEIVDGLIDDMLSIGGEVDLVDMLSLPVPSLVICELLGVPYEDHDFFQGNTRKFASRDNVEEERHAAVGRLRSYLSDLVTAKEADPGDDLLGRQIVKLRAEGTYEHEALVSLAFSLLVAGHETTANMISLGTVALLENPDQLAKIQADPGRTLPAIEELLRYFTIVDAVTARVATEDVEISGTTIRAGDGVVVLGYPANWDPDVFASPERLDLERGARHHVAFGFGPHQCLGQNLARAELQIVFDTLFRRIPTLKLAKPVDDLAFKDEAAIYGLYQLPVTW
ncbi:cytochrome P450 [Amycolatopsis jiangsuensis]|uniref:Cytochrome P450 n=1 Tax=Amycolatopsis jiangsuensis TaxID=1181879 RepID=A0A840IYH7_9PSEU|nr:cytochrome P450 [Amycolatopsis jiangsuensis]MBB4686262.1 cytochrome P450 [Amycolatopsis jiangsuensis]